MCFINEKIDKKCPLFSATKCIVYHLKGTLSD